MVLSIILVLRVVCTLLAGQECALDAANAQDGGESKLKFQENPDTGLDPTVQTSKIGIQNLFTKQPHGAYLDQVILKGTYAFGFSGKNDCSISVALPAMAHFDPGNMAGAAGAYGIGDTNLRALQKYLFTFSLTMGT
jgi:hypothetical protein